MIIRHALNPSRFTDRIEDQRIEEMVVDVIDSKVSPSVTISD